MSNLYYLVGESLSGHYNLSLDLKKWTVATLVIKNHNGTGSDTGSTTQVQVSGSATNQNVTVTSGRDPSASFIGYQGHVDLKLKLGNTPKDVYIVLTNSEKDAADRETSFDNGALARKNRKLTPPNRRMNRVFGSEPRGLLYQAHRFNRTAGRYLKRNRIKDPK